MQIQLKCEFEEILEPLGQDAAPLYSQNELDIAAIRQQLEQTSGNFIEKVRRVLSHKLVATENINFATAEIKFSAVSHDKTVVALIVEMEHTQ